MKLATKILNLIIAIYFFLAANFFFWMGLVLLAWNVTEGGHIEPGRILMPASDLVFSIIFMVCFVLFGFKKRNRYKVGLGTIAIFWASIQLTRLVFITQWKLERADLGNLLLFGVPFVVICVADYLDREKR